MNSNADIQILIENPVFVAISFAVIAVLVFLKGAALWRAGRNNQKGWFIVLLVVNTLGLLETIYLLTAGKKKS